MKWNQIFDAMKIASVRRRADVNIKDSTVPPSYKESYINVEEGDLKRQKSLLKSFQPDDKNKVEVLPDDDVKDKLKNGGLFEEPYNKPDKEPGINNPAFSDKEETPYISVKQVITY